MKITEVIKKDGSKVYRANVYLGVDQVTGKKSQNQGNRSDTKGSKTESQSRKNSFSESRIYQTKRLAP